MKTKKLWNNIREELKNNIFNKEILKKFINSFYNEIVINITEDQHILFIFRIELINKDIKTTTKLLKITNENKNKETIISYLLDSINRSLDSYNNSPINSLIISYGIRKGKITPTISKTVEPQSEHIYYNHKLPIAIKSEDYGDVIGEFGDTKIIQFKKNIILFISSDGKDNKNIIKYFKNGKLIYEWIDYLKEDNSLIREIGKTTLFWKDNEIIWTKVLKRSKPITKKKLSSDLNEKFITMDLETISINKDKGVTLNPYLLCWYDGKKDKHHSYFIGESYGFKNIFYQLMKDICVRKYKGYKIYLHNFSKFDSIFLIKYLVQIGKCDPVIHKGKIISFSFKPNWKKDFGRITFLDSYLLLPSSLKILSNSFSIDNPKTIFPIFLNDIHYKGPVPSYNYFKGISLEDYNNYKESFINKEWSFREESIKYCINDCKALYQILSKFNKLIFSKFHLNIVEYPTLPSLAFSIFRGSYYKKEVIQQLSGDIDRDIRLGYTGGSTDMFIPFPKEGVKIYVYDVNSLYPATMVNNPYPVGAPTYFEGDITLNNPEAFGFFYCKIITPPFLDHPILQIHYKTNGGIRTISPLGTFEGWFFSPELENSKKFGYKYEILRGYTFDKDYIFKDYVNDIYNLRLSYSKTDPMNYTAKILLNSLYGRFGMNDDFNILLIVNEKELREIEESDFQIENITPLFGTSKNKYLISFINPDNKLITKMDGNKENHNINIAIASAVTAYARIHMSQFKNNPNLPNLYYSDTDSLYFDGPIPDHFISNTILGKLKLEGIYNKAIFLAPKVYALENEKEKIIKIKGLTKESILENNITLTALETLLNKDYKLIFNQNKWFRSLSEANINILEQTYNLKVTGNKRELIYKDGKLIGTKPLKINNPPT